MFSYSYKHLQNPKVMKDDLENLIDHHEIKEHGRPSYSYRHGYNKDGEAVWIIDLRFRIIHFCNQNHKILFQIKFG